MQTGIKEGRITMEESFYNYDGNAGELDYFYIQSYVAESIDLSIKSDSFEEFDFGAKDLEGNDYYFRCLGFAAIDRFGTQRIYIAVKDLEDEEDLWRCGYIVRCRDGAWLLVKETEAEMFEKFKAAMRKAAEVSEEKKRTKKRKGWLIALKVITFPFWLLWQFVKALLSLINIGVGDSSLVKAFKKGLGTNNDGSYQEYEFINDMGCRQTVYSSNGKDFYAADGSYVGSSNDGGKTIK